LVGVPNYNSVGKGEALMKRWRQGKKLFSPPSIQEKISKEREKKREKRGKQSARKRKKKVGS